MKLFVKIEDNWLVNPELITNFQKSNPTKMDNRAEIKAYILEQVLNNKGFMKSILKNSEKEIPDVFTFGFNLNPDDTLSLMHLSAQDVLDYYSKNIDNLNRWQKKIYEGLKITLTKEYQYKVYSKKKITSNITYSDLFNILKLPKEEIDKLIKNNNFRGVSGVKFNKIIEKHILSNIPIKDRLFEIFNITTDEKYVIEQNIERIDYHYKENIYAKREFVESRNIIDEFELNDKIKNSVLNNMPKGLNKLQQTYYIYRRLCQLFIFDEDEIGYELIKREKGRAKKPYIDHANIKRLNDIGVNDEVVCTEITMLYAKFIELLGLPYQIVNYSNETDIDYEYDHMRINFKIGDVIFEADPTMGTYYMDMINEKTTGKVRYFGPKHDIPLRIKEEIKKQLEVVDKYMEKSTEQMNFEDAVKEYENTYKKKNNITPGEKVSMIINTIQNSSLKLIELIQIVHKLKKQMFTTSKSACRIETIINQKPAQMNKAYEVVLGIVYNDNNDIDMMPETNKFIIINSDKSIEDLKFSDVRKRFEDDTYSFGSSDRMNYYKTWIGEDVLKYDEEHRI